MAKTPEQIVKHIMSGHTPKRDKWVKDREVEEANSPDFMEDLLAVKTNKYIKFNKGFNRNKYKTLGRNY